MGTFKIATNNINRQSFTLKDDYQVVNMLTATFVAPEHLTKNRYYTSRTGFTCGINFMGSLLPHYQIVDCDSQSGYSTQTIKDTHGRVWNIGVQKAGRKGTPMLFAYHWEDAYTQFVFLRKVSDYNYKTFRKVGQYEADTLSYLSNFSKDDRLETKIWKADKTQSEPYVITIYSNLPHKHVGIGKNPMAGFDGSDNSDNSFNTPYLYMANSDFFMAKYGYADSCLLGFNPYMGSDMTYREFNNKFLDENNHQKGIGKFHQIGAKYPEKNCKEIFAIATKQTYVSNGEGCEFWVRSNRGQLVAQMFVQIRGTWFEYELEIPSLTNLDQIAHDLKRGCQRKALESMKDYNKLTMKVILRDIPQDYIITIADSTSTGNCEYGTKQFCEQFGLPTNEITFGELVAMPKFNQMCSNPRFIATLKKVVANIKGTELAIPSIYNTDEEA